MLHVYFTELISTTKQRGLEWPLLCRWEIDFMFYVVFWNLNTDLFQAARYGHQRVVDILVRKDPGGVNIQSGGGCTPLMLVCMAPNQAVLNDGDIVKRMLDVAEIDLDLKDGQGKTALDWARDKELFMIEKLIMERSTAAKAESLPEVKIRELEDKLKKSEETNFSLRKNIEELSLRIKEQDEKLQNLRSH